MIKVKILIWGIQTIYSSGRLNTHSIAITLGIKNNSICSYAIPSFCSCTILNQISPSFSRRNFFMPFAIPFRKDYFLFIGYSSKNFELISIVIKYNCSQMLSKQFPRCLNPCLIEVDNLSHQIAQLSGLLNWALIVWIPPISEYSQI